MTDFIASLLRSPEGKTLEFKRDLSSPRPLLKTLVAFANTAGGRLLIGVSDDKAVIGVDHPLDEEERLANLIADSIAPRLVPTIEMVTVEGKTLLIVEVFLSGTRPHFIKTDGIENGVYVRLGSTVRQADAPLIAELQRGVAGISFDSLPMPHLSQDDLDLDAIQSDFRAKSIDATMPIRIAPKKYLITPFVQHSGGAIPSTLPTAPQAADAVLHCDLHQIVRPAPLVPAMDALGVNRIGMVAPIRVR